MANAVHGGLLRGVRGDAHLATTGVDAAHYGVVAAGVSCYRLLVGPTYSVQPHDIARKGGGSIPVHVLLGMPLTALAKFHGSWICMDMAVHVFSVGGVYVPVNSSCAVI